MARVTQAEVSEIIDTSVVDFQPYILAADTYVTEALADFIDNAALLKEITRWLSAHMIAVATNNTSTMVEHQTGETRARWADLSMGKYLELTRYGQTAIALDPTGILRRAGQGTKITFSAVITNEDFTP